VAVDASSLEPEASMLDIMKHWSNWKPDSHRKARSSPGEPPDRSAALKVDD
jgi:hypothetical protein